MSPQDDEDSRFWIWEATGAMQACDAWSWQLCCIALHYVTFDSGFCRGLLGSSNWAICIKGVLAADETGASLASAIWSSEMGISRRVYAGTS